MSTAGTRTALANIPRRSFKAEDVIAVLENIIAETGTAPTYLRCDNGPEFTAAALIEWCNTAGVAQRSSTRDHPGRTASSNPSTPNSEGNNLPEKSWTPWPKPSIWPTNGKLSTIMNGPTDPCTA
ncbi:UNVERIFIED_ORG: hypothetical protein J2X79_001983 [Arthrobacter globiformis]|nr:hypothetical protein [Arthrobacter globiformis]